MQTETNVVETAAVDTNEEYILANNVVKQPPVLTSVFKYIFLETPKDFFKGIIGFFVRYIRHFIHGFKYFWTPSLKVPPFDNKDFKEDSQRTFELALIITAFLIFMIKSDFIPVNEELQEVYGNDITEMFMNFSIFLIFGFTYLIMVLISVVLGRIMKVFFRPKISGKEADILFTYLNNSLFSITVVVAFMFRCGIQFEEVKDDKVFEQNVFLLYLFLFTPVMLIWSSRFSKFNGINSFRKVLFILVSLTLFSILFAFTSYAVTFLILGT